MLWFPPWRGNAVVSSLAPVVVRMTWPAGVWALPTPPYPTKDSVLARQRFNVPSGVWYRTAEYTLDGPRLAIHLLSVVLLSLVVSSVPVSRMNTK